MFKPKNILGIAILAGVASFLTYSLLLYPPISPDASPGSLTREIVPTPSVRIGKTTIGVEIARDAAAIRKGLSGRISLEAERGMLFVFSKPARYRFWMPDMHFPIDIICIADGQVAAIDENAAPQDDLANPRFYTPPQPVTHVLEVNAGFARRQNISIGNQVTLPH
ncbi:MAG: DUF192 domain-containing protein [Candidatus Sungbacteria bacterium]|nr:DUF192 domain-containing protein [Candidatus Sungbacteria bacterium]